jgi:flagellar hook assembly protein FlgD
MLGVVNVQGGSSVDEGQDLSAAVRFRASPNPVKYITRFQFGLNHGSQVVVEVLDVQGRKVRTLYEGELSAGVHSVPWNLEGDSGQTLSAGVYFARLASEEFTQIVKVYLVR